MGRKSKYNLENVKETKCRQCFYNVYCSGLSSELRLSCTQYRWDDNPNRRYSSKWSEMSYYQIAAKEKRSLSQRVRDGE